MKFYPLDRFVDIRSRNAENHIGEQLAHQVRGDGTIAGKQFKNCFLNIYLNRFHLFSPCRYNVYARFYERSTGKRKNIAGKKKLDETMTCAHLARPRRPSINEKPPTVRAAEGSSGRGAQGVLNAVITFIVTEPVWQGRSPNA
jgi:hypothetical protein